LPLNDRERSSPMSASKWTEADVPDQTGRVAIVTGSNTGLGFEGLSEQRWI
jgi:hypothetical protein